MPQEITPVKHSTRLADLLQSTFGLHRARITCLAALVIALFRVRAVNLAQLATAEQENACDHLQQKLSDLLLRAT